VPPPAKLTRNGVCEMIMIPRQRGRRRHNPLGR